VSNPDTSTILPKHVAIIMDGNGRWARARNLSNSEGHKAGLGPLRSVIESCGELGIQALTVFAFSSENWKRPDQEVSSLMQLFMDSLENEIDELNQKQVQLRVIGSRRKFDSALKQQMSKCEALTESNNGLVFSIAVDYGGRWDIVEAAKSLAEDCVSGKLQVENISEEDFASRTNNADLPDPDLCIRTGGEYRISNFLLWQFAYTELLVNECLWPDYGKEKFLEDLNTFAERERRFGQSG
jgi:undecaprenyl diphosphate synthase